MSSPDQEHKSEATSLDAERARLRSAGYTDAEVSQILIASASQQPAATGQGALSNVLSSILGVASHARALIPTFRKDVETVFDGAATASARAGAVASLAVKAIVVIVLGYAAWQEWQQHIISQTEIAAQLHLSRRRVRECMRVTAFAPCVQATFHQARSLQIVPQAARGSRMGVAIPCSCIVKCVLVATMAVVR